MQGIYAWVVFLAILVVGDLVSLKTKARIPMLFTSLFLYLLLIWVGMPKNLADVAYIKAAGGIVIPMLILHMGTMIPFKEIKMQWKPVVVTLAGLAGILIALFGIGQFIIGYKEVVSGAGPISGGVIAAIVTIENLTKKGLSEITVIPAMVLGLQFLIGIPLSSIFLKKYALSIKNNMSLEGSSIEDQANKKKQDETEIKYFLSGPYETSFNILLTVAIGSSIAVYIGGLTGIDRTIWALFIGMLGAYYGIYRKDVLTRANSFGIVSFIITAYILTLMNDITPQGIASRAFAIFTILILGTIGIIVGSYVLAKILRFDSRLAIAVALTAEFGFPANYWISYEVSRSVGENKKEEAYILDRILTPMLVGGYISVTITSVIIAGILVKTL
jgi:hypothetical protein